MECVDLLNHHAERFNLTEKDLFKLVTEFYKIADTDNNCKISLIEFFVQLPHLEEFLSKQLVDRFG